MKEVAQDFNRAEYIEYFNQLINEIKIKENNLKKLQQPAQKKLT